MILATFTAAEWSLILTAATAAVVAVVGAIAAGAVKIIQALNTHGDDLKANTDALRQTADAINQQTKP